MAADGVGEAADTADGVVAPGAVIGVTVASTRRMARGRAVADRGPVASRLVLDRPVPPDTAWNRALGAAKRAAGEIVHVAWETAGEWAAIGPSTRRGRRLARSATAV